MDKSEILERVDRMQGNPSLRITEFNRVDAKRGNPVEYEWKEFLRRLAEPKATAETVAEYNAMNKGQRLKAKDVGGFVGGIFENNRRRKSNLRYRSLIALDIDDGDAETIEAIESALDNRSTPSMNGALYAIYSTHSHTPQCPRYRLILPLRGTCTTGEYVDIARHIAGKIGGKYFDNTTYEAERIMFWPSVSQDAVKDYVFEFGGYQAIAARDVLDEIRAEREQPPASGFTAATPQPLAQHGARSQAQAQPATTPGDYWDIPGDARREAQDPTTKEGIVGDFCRAMTITQAIETYLPHVYRRAGGNRYTFINGSTAGGLVVDEAKNLAWSHHSTDPAGGGDCHALNAFDIIRIHNFGDRDRNSKATDPAKMPSFKAMCEWAQTVPEYQDFKAREIYNAFKDVTLGGEAEASGETPQNAPQSPHNQSAKPQRSDTPQDGQNGENGADLHEWAKGMELDKQGKLKSSAKNIEAIMSNAPFMRGVKYNDFTHRVYVLNALPWDTHSVLPRPWSDTDAAGLRQFLEKELGIVAKEKIKDGFAVSTYTRHYHPIRDYFNGLPAWDNVPRLDRLIIDYLGAEDNELTRTMTRIHFVAAVARVFEPGCKYDYVLTFKGPENCGKSSFVKIMGDPWNGESFYTFEGKEAMEQIQGKWLVELPELAALKNLKINETAKAFITRQHDSFRGAYKENSETHARQCVFFATTNEDQFLKGSTGNRRFWIIEIKPELRKSELTKKVWLIANRAQIWAEALHRYRTEAKATAHDLYFNLPEHLAALAKEQQEEANINNDPDLLAQVKVFVEIPIPNNYAQMTLKARQDYYKFREEGLSPLVSRMEFCIKQFVHEYLGVPLSNNKEYKETANKFKSGLLKKLDGWRKDRKKFFENYDKQWSYVREGEPPQIDSARIIDDDEDDEDL